MFFSQYWLWVKYTWIIKVSYMWETHLSIFAQEDQLQGTLEGSPSRRLVTVALVYNIVAQFYLEHFSSRSPSKDIDSYSDSWSRAITNITAGKRIWKECGMEWANQHKCITGDRKTLLFLTVVCHKHLVCEYQHYIGNIKAISFWLLNTLCCCFFLLGDNYNALLASVVQLESVLIICMHRASQGH